MSRVLRYEGGYSNHPKDPGGVTLQGVIQRVYDGYRQRRGLDARPLTAALLGKPDWEAERDEIYRIQYWDKIRGDDLPAGVDFAVFDAAVNSGPVQAVKWLQRSIRVNAVDGMIGEATLAAVELTSDHDQLVADICSRRLAFMRQLKTWSVFGKGWEARVASVVSIGQAWAMGSVGPAPAQVSHIGGAAKANEVDLSKAPVSVGVGTSASTGGTIVTGTLDTLQSSTTAIQPLADSMAVAKYVVLAMTIIVAGVTLYGIYRERKVARARDGLDTAVVPAEVF